MEEQEVPLIPQHLAPLLPILDAMQVGILILDASGTILAINESMRRFYQGGEVPYPGYPLSDFNASDWVEAKRVLTSGLPLVGAIMQLPAASVVVNRNPIIQDGRVIGVVGYMQEIGKLESIVKQLKTYQELDGTIDSILEQCPQGLMIVDSNNIIVRTNSHFASLCGTGKDTLVGLDMADIPVDATHSAEVVQPCLQTGQPQHLHRLSDNNTALLLQARPIVDNHNNVQYVVASITNLEQLDALRLHLGNGSELNTKYLDSVREQDALSKIAGEFGFVARSRSMMQVVQRAAKVSQTESSVLLQGESGVGKSMLAGLIHRLSLRSSGPFVSINCGAIPEQLMESELFGYDRGAFTGADPKGKIGLIESGHCGTVFFDEIGELNLPMQVKLLEVIDKKVFLRVGGTRPISVDFRIVAATNKNLEDEVANGNFRRDLFYRLNVIPIIIPPLRERKEDIAAMALDMLARYNANHSMKKRLSPEVVDILLQHTFSGNARELSNIMEWMMVMSEEHMLRPQDLPTAFRNKHSQEFLNDNAIQVQSLVPTQYDKLVNNKKTLKEILFEVEDVCLRCALKRNSSMNATAQELGMHPTTLWRKLVQHKIAQERAL